MGVMLIFLINAYSSTQGRITELRKGLPEEMDQMQFPALKNSMLAKKSERICYIIITVFGILITVCLAIFHPIWGYNNNSYYFYLVPNTPNSDIISRILYLALMVIFALMIQSMIFEILVVYYVIWSIHLLHFRITEYIEIHLCKIYFDFEVISSESEQNSIYLHLLKIAKQHSTLKK